MTHSALADRTQWTSDRSSRDGARVDRFIVHHAATTSLAAILALFQPGGRQVSANYALGSDGTLVATVDEVYRAWTSASYIDDRRAVTIEVANSSAGGSWPVSDAAFDKLARLIADVAGRYGFPITDDTVLTHQELYTRFGRSYATACPGDLQRRKGELLRLANHYLGGGSGSAVVTPTQPAAPDIESEEDDDMPKLYRIKETGRHYAIAPRFIKQITSKKSVQGYEDAHHTTGLKEIEVSSWSFGVILGVNGIPSSVINANGHVLDETTGKYVHGGDWAGYDALAAPVRDIRKVIGSTVARADDGDTLGTRLDNLTNLATETRRVLGRPTDRESIGVSLDGITAHLSGRKQLDPEA